MQTHTKGRSRTRAQCVLVAPCWAGTGSTLSWVHACACLYVHTGSSLATVAHWGEKQAQLVSTVMPHSRCTEARGREGVWCLSTGGGYINVCVCSASVRCGLYKHTVVRQWIICAVKSNSLCIDKKDTSL